MTNVIEADLTWTGREPRAGDPARMDPADASLRVGRLGLRPTSRLPGQGLLPGMVDVHSHAFQRGIRGRGERFPAGAGNFWTWREAMYDLVTRLDDDGLYRLSLQAFREMLATGITTVGEFHYFHHSRGTLDFSGDRAVLRAARDPGSGSCCSIRITAPAASASRCPPPQKRFETAFTGGILGADGPAWGRAWIPAGESRRRGAQRPGGHARGNRSAARGGGPPRPRVSSPRRGTAPGSRRLPGRLWGRADGPAQPGPGNPTERHRRPLYPHGARRHGGVPRREVARCVSAR